MSVVLHELFHVIMHWGEIVSVRIFPDLYTIVAIQSHSTPGYNVSNEELIAYGITIVVLLATLDLITVFRDATDHRTSREILIGKSSELASLNQDEYNALLLKAKV